MKRAEEPRQIVLDLLRRRGPMSIDALGPLLELSKTATRAHVLRLEKDGLVRRVEAEPDGPGRPRVRFTLTERGGAAFPTADADVLERLLSFLESAGQARLIEKFFEELWSERRSLLLETLDTDAFADAPLSKRLRHLERLLERSQFMPRIERRARADGKLVVVQECNCPLPAAVRATKIPCRLEAEFLANVVGGKALDARVAADRSDTCTFEFLVQNSG
jgi:predicted ArsR family transcriptional regulator